MVDKDNHGSCVHCGVDLNGERIYDYFLREYGGDSVRAEETASMYGATKDSGRFGKEVYVKDLYKRTPSFFQCPSCGEKCYDET